jgi:hypothetical protein
MTEKARKTHSELCVAHNRLYATLAMVYSLGMSASCWFELDKPFPGPPQPLTVVLGVPAFAFLSVYLFLALKCIWERLWLGPAAANFLIVCVKMFDPDLVARGIGALRIVSLVLWLWTLLVSFVFVKSAFAPNKMRTPTGADPGP